METTLNNIAINYTNKQIDNILAVHDTIPPGLLFERKCPCCGSNNYNFELEKDHLKIVRCVECDSVFVNPVFNEDHYKKTYQSDEYQNIVKDLGEESHIYRVNRFGKERINIMSSYVLKDEKIKYLDIGCSTGFVVEEAQNRGWDAYGIDLNPSAIEFGKKRGLTLNNISLKELNQDDVFDVVSLFDVLEHVVNPKEILEQALMHLKEDGIIFIYVPNYDSASRILMGKEAHFIWPTHHLTYFNPKTITFLLESLGMKIELLTTEGLDIVDYIWHQKEIKNEDISALEDIQDKLQFFINAGCYGKNLRILARKKS